jgi:RNA polymerase sigma factor (TIGR02999 family)
MVIEKIYLAPGIASSALPDLSELRKLSQGKPAPERLTLFILDRWFILAAMSNVTQLLNASRAGDGKAEEQLLELVYEELRKLATAKMAREKPGQTLQPTALVHEAWLRLGGAPLQFQNSTHFFGAAAEAMRRILIERARRRVAAKRGNGAISIDADEIEIPSPIADDAQLLDVNEALERFALLDPRKAALVKFRYFVGLSFEEAASVLGISVPTAKQWWAYSRAWLKVELRKTEK